MLFDERVKLLRAFFLKNKRLPMYREKTHGDLGPYTVYLRHRIKTGTLPEQQIEYLDRLGLLSAITKKEYRKRVTDGYREKVKLLKRFREKYKRLPLKREEFEGIPIGVWCSTQKYLYHKGQLGDEQAALLEPTGLLSTGRYHLYERVNAIGDFYETYHRMPYQDDIAKSNPIGQWWYRLRRQICRYQLSQADMDYISETRPYLIEFAREWGDHGFSRWLKLLKEYQSDTGRVCPPAQAVWHGENLGRWCVRQKNLARQGKLSQDRIIALKETGLLDNVQIRKK